jgi:hypothetical protein
MCKHNLLQFLKLLFVSLCFISLNLNCSKKDEPYSFLKITPTDLILNANSQDWITFNLNGFAKEGFINLRIKQKKKNTSSQIILDSTYTSVNNFNLLWEYQVPDSTSDYSLDLIFTLTDTQGEVYNVGRTLMVNAVNTPLQEYEGIILHSHESGLADYLNIELLNLGISSLSNNSIQQLRDDSVSMINTSQLSKAFISPAGGKFTKFNDFNYAEATSNSLTSAINSSSMVDRISSLQTNDIILFKLNNIHASIRISAINDLAGTTDDTYVLNIKRFIN